MFIPADLNGEVRNSGFYEKFKYRYWGYAKIPSNPQDCATNNRRVLGESQGINPISERPLRPRYLCFLDEVNGVSVEKVEDLISRKGIEYDMNYIFVALRTSNSLRARLKTWKLSTISHREQPEPLVSQHTGLDAAACLTKTR
jgi:hypothetical protein